MGGHLTGPPPGNGDHGTGGPTLTRDHHDVSGAKVIRSSCPRRLSSSVLGDAYQPSTEVISKCGF
jgi:hypothetical protein